MAMKPGGKPTKQGSGGGPTTPLSGLGLRRGTWSTLNHFRVDAGSCRSSLFKWKVIDSPLCDYCEEQTLRHLANSCPHHQFDDGIQAFKKPGEEAIKWLKRTSKVLSKRQYNIYWLLRILVGPTKHKSLIRFNSQMLSVD